MGVPRQMNKVAVLRALADAEVAISELRKDIESGSHDDSGPMVLAVPFQYVLWNLCLAWHSRRLTDLELSSLTTEQDDSMRDSVPNWGLSFRMVDVDEDIPFQVE